MRWQVISGDTLLMGQEREIASLREAGSVFCTFGSSDHNYMKWLGISCFR